MCLLSPLPLNLPNPPLPFPRPRPGCCALLWEGEPETVEDEGGRATLGRDGPPKRFTPSNCFGRSLTMVVRFRGFRRSSNGVESMVMLLTVTVHGPFYNVLHGRVDALALRGIR